MANSRREALNDKLVALLGNENVYFQPPDGTQMEYPCIVYNRDDSSVHAADNIKYHWMQRYQVTLMDYDPDSDAIKKLMEFPYSAFDRHFATSGLNHDVFVIYH